MSESPKEKPQTLSGYTSLVKKIENIINQITENEELTTTEEEDPLEQQDSEIVTEKESSAEAVIKVEKQTLQLEESITKVADEEKKEVQAEKLPDLVKIENELGELYPGAEVQVTDFYYAKDELPDDEIKKRIKSKIPSLEEINIKNKENYGFPFVLCKLEGHYEAIIPINLENISLPTIQHGVNRQFKLLFAGTEEVLELTPSENEIWNQSFNRFQIKLTQLLNTKVKSNLSKKPYKMKLIDLDSILIKDFINEYHKKLKNLQNYQDDILLHLHELIGIVERREGIWKNTDDFSKTKKMLKLQMIDFEKKKKNLSKETQIEFFKLKKTQRKLDARTKKFKLDEKRNKTITREEKEALINDVRKFQKKKAEIQKEIDHAKKIDETLKEWIEILTSLGLEEANAKFLEAFSEDFSKNILELLEHENLEEFLEKAFIESADFSNITLHVLYIPTLIYSFKAKQGSQKIEGKILYLAPAQETIFLKPPVA
ncbi:MAG: hypothetical protein GPJ51_09025 [Candidatus Heimdallarchaeota archaeon]|nr:hypothetical protein [Candidatus Heimdallarchaeota archaeon]